MPTCRRTVARLFWPLLCLAFACGSLPAQAAGAPRAMLLVSAPPPLASAVLRLLQRELRQDLTFISVDEFMRASQRSKQHGNLSMATAMRLAPALQMRFGISVRAQKVAAGQRSDLEVVVMAMLPRPRVLAVQRYALPHHQLEQPTAASMADDLRRQLATAEGPPPAHPAAAAADPAATASDNDEAAAKDDEGSLTGAPVEITVFRRKRGAPPPPTPDDPQWSLQLAALGGARLAQISGALAAPPPLHFGEGTSNVVAAQLELRGLWVSARRGPTWATELALAGAWLPQTVTAGSISRFTHLWPLRGSAYLAYRWAVDDGMTLGPEVGYRYVRQIVVDGPFPSLVAHSPSVGLAYVASEGPLPLQIKGRAALLALPMWGGEANRLGKAAGYRPGAVAELQLSHRLGPVSLGGHVAVEYLGRSFLGTSFLPTPVPFTDASLHDITLHLGLLLEIAS